MDQTQPLPPPTHTSDGMAAELEPFELHGSLEKKSKETPHPSGSSSDTVYSPIREVVPIMLGLCSAVFLFALLSPTTAPLRELIPLQFATPPKVS
jgi:hypothetical protein